MTGGFFAQPKPQRTGEFYKRMADLPTPESLRTYEVPDHNPVPRKDRREQQRWQRRLERKLRRGA